MSQINDGMPAKKKNKKIILIIAAVIVGLCVLCLVFGFLLQGLEAVGLRATRTPMPTVTNTAEPSPTNTPEPTPTFTPEPTFTQTPEPVTIVDINVLLNMSPIEVYDMFIDKYGEPSSEIEQDGDQDAEANWLLETEQILFGLIYFQEDDGSFSEYLIIITGAIEDGHTNQSLMEYFNIDPDSEDYYVLVNPWELETAAQIWISPDYIDYFSEATITPEHEPITLIGAGDDVVDFDNPFDIAIVKITGNAAGRYFGVKNFGPDGSQYSLLVNTTDPYEGIRPLDFFDNELTTRFEITAVGEWKIEILSITEARTLEVPGEIEGSGDDVILLTGSEPDIATIKGNASSRYFGVIGYHARRDLLVNTTDPYNGRVNLNRNTLVLEIVSVDDWSIVVE